MPGRAGASLRLGRRGALLAWMLCAACWISSCSDSPKPNVVVIMLDTARPDYLSVYGHPRPTTPYLEEFAATGTRYDRAYSTASWTLPAHASLFSGTLAEIHRATQTNTMVDPQLPLLAEQLQRDGYETAGFSNNSWISKATGLDRGFTTFMDGWKRHASQEKGATIHPTVAAVQSWFASRAESKQPFFLFVNLIEPHMPYLSNWQDAAAFFESKRAWQSALERLFPEDESNQTTVRHYARETPLTESEWHDLRRLYESSLRRTDGVVRSIMAAVDAASERENTLVFLVSDHGENLGDHEHVSHIFNLYDSNLRILLLARGPGFVAGAKDAHLVQITDVHRTILHAADIRAGDDCSGLDLREPLPDQRLLAASLVYPKISLGLFPENMRQEGGALDPYKRELRSAISTRWKYIRGSDGTVEIYDLLEDPHEQRPLDPQAVGLDVVKGFEAFIETTKSRVRGHPERGLPEDPEVLESLRALGYTQ